MNLRALLAKCGLSELKIKCPILDATFVTDDATRNAAWALYVELVTRIAVQPLGSDEGDEAAALKSLHSLFGTTREVLKGAGPTTVRFAAVAVTFLNQTVRPLTAKWHPRVMRGDLDTPEGKKEFREDLGRIRKLILGYVAMVGELAGIEENDQFLNA